MPRFNVTYEESGFAVEGVSLREALSATASAGGMV